MQLSCMIVNYVEMSLIDLTQICRIHVIPRKCLHFPTLSLMEAAPPLLKLGSDLAQACLPYLHAY
jgi:hypothetical protein